MELEKQMELLRGVGLTEGEIKVYLLLLKKGDLKAGQISKKTELNRSHLYKILENLVRKKLIFSSILNKTKIFSITRVERLNEIYNEKLNDLQEKSKEIRRFISHTKELPLLSSDLGFGIEVHEGVNEIKPIIQEVFNLKKGEKICAFGKQGVLAEFPGIKYWFDSLVKKRIKKGIIFKAVYNLHEKTRKSKSSLTKIKYTNLSNIGDIEIAFYRDILLIYIMEKKRPRVILIRNKMVVEAMNSYFNLLWEKAKEA